MKRIFSLIVCAVFATSVIAQNTVVNDKNAVVRNVSGFHAIQISHGIDLYLAQGNNEGVAISATNEKYRSNIKTEVIDGVLKIFYDDAGTNVHISWNGNRQMKAYVTVKDITMLGASGGSDVYIQGQLHASNLDLRLSGGSDFSGAVDISKLIVNASGGSDVKISGKAASLSVDANGGSDFHGYDLSSDNCDVDASGGSDVYVTVNKEMNVSASGGSDVSYKGNGVIRNSSASGGSGVKKRG